MKEKRRQPKLLVTTRVADMADPRSPSEILRCDDCGMAGWRSFTSPRTRRIYCMQCAADRIGPGDEIAAPTAEQIKVIKRALRNS
jgi:hypothetical protein